MQFIGDTSGGYGKIDAVHVVDDNTDKDERQHTEAVKFFDRRETVSGVGRGEQRKLYDQKRRDILPKNGIRLIEFDYSEFEHTKGKKLVRNKTEDLRVIKKKLDKI